MKLEESFTPLASSIYESNTTLLSNEMHKIKAYKVQEIIVQLYTRL